MLARLLPVSHWNNGLLNRVFQLSARRRRPRVQRDYSPISVSRSSNTTSSECLAETIREAREKLLVAGFDPTSFFEQPIVWGDHDAFQHVNNVRYVRYFESGRITWLSSLAFEIGGQEKVDAMLKAKGTSLILKSIEVRYKRPVTFPDTLLIAHKAAPIVSSLPSTTHFKLVAAAYSYTQCAVVAESECVLVWYDYEKLRKCNPGEKALEVLQRRMRAGQVKIKDEESNSVPA